jgi:hypothetical protein
LITQNTLTNMRIEETIKRILREELSSHNGNESKRHKVFYGFQGLPNFWSDDYDRVINDSYFDDKDYNDYYFDNFYDMDKEFGHEKSLFGTKGLPVGHPNRSSKSFDMYNDQYGPAIVRVVDERIVCQECGWSWDLSDGGDDPYTCHKCGHENV